MKPNNIAFSCVVDTDPKFYLQSMIWYWGLRENLSIDSSCIFVHMVKGCDPEVVEYFESQGVNVKLVDRVSTFSPPLNKLAQLDNDELNSFSYIVLSDCDKVYFEAILDWFSGDAIKACFFVAKPPFSVFKNIYQAYGLDFGKFTYRPMPKDEDDPRSLPNNVNGGTYIIPRERWAGLANEWKRATEFLVDNNSMVEKWSRNIDQIAFCMAMDKLDWEVSELPKYFDIGVNVRNAPQNHDEFFTVGALHYHASLNPSGVIESGANAHVKVKQAINKANNMVSERLMNNPVFRKYLVMNPKPNVELKSRFWKRFSW
jgi:hypothetical protein